MKSLRLCIVLGVFILSWATLAQAVSVPYIIDLPSPFNQSMGRAINTSDWVVGEMWTASGPPWPSDAVHPWVPFLFSGSGTAIALTGYNGSGLFNSTDDYQTQDLSNTGSMVVGYVRNVALLPWVWDPTNQFRQLPVPDGYISAQAIRIDDSTGIILGRAQKADGTDDLVQWTWDDNLKQYVFTDTGQSGDSLPYDRNNINETNGHHSSTFISTSTYGIRAAVKGPIECPEPSLLLLFGASLFGLGVIAKRRMIK